MVLEVNCVSNLSPNQLTTLRSSVRESLILHNMMLLIEVGDLLTDVQWLLYLQDCGCYCMLFDTSRCDLSHADIQWLLTARSGCKIV